MHISGAVDELLKDEAATREFTSADVVALVLVGPPTEAIRPAIELQATQAWKALRTGQRQGEAEGLVARLSG